ncbi:MAG TPA: hypothetical protein DCZ95_06085 [Verrucomicrobia bacterium]|nr:MAG: hypothetical protein A2X46_03885 [Lentisphaerae bacterium GWF2_57_35]HBA83647.1 hypothetical protein [Verrucomicrobiota bacterium]
MNLHKTCYLAILLAGMSLPAGSAPATLVAPARSDGTQAVTRIAMDPPSRELAPQTVPLIWQNDLELALVDAAAQYRSVLVFMTAPNCIYCRRLKDQVFSEPDIQELLHQFTLMEIDVQRHPAMGRQFGLQGVPALLILASDGRERERIVGYVGRDDLRKILLSALGQGESAFRSAEELSVDALLDQETIRDDQWATLVAAMGQKELRDSIRERLRTTSPFPRKALVGLLTNPRLAVRLGVMELLEEAAGDDFGLDPWSTDAAAPDREEALGAWQRWAEEETADAHRVFAALTTEQIDAYLRDLTAEKRERYLRAMRQLEQAGPQVQGAIEAFASAHPDMSPSARRRLREVEYTLLIPSQGGLEPEVLAHRLVFGNLDAQLQALRELGRMGRPAIPVLKFFLEDDQALIRETALEALSGAGTAAIPLLLDRTARETDPDVMIALVRAAGSLGDPDALPIVKKYIRHSNEDVVMAALQNTATLERGELQDEFAACLKDPRWRVRAAAAEAASKSKRKELAGTLETLLEDEEPFVRYRAIQALVGIEGKSSAGKFSELFLREDNLKAPIVMAFGELELNIPKTFITALNGKEPGLLLAVLQELGKSKERGLPLASHLAEHPDSDVACAAIRLLGEQGMKKPECQRQLLKLLREGDRDRQWAALQSIQLAETHSYNQWDAWDVLTPDSTGAAAPGEPSLLDALADAFSEAVKNSTPEPPAPAANPPASASMEELFAAFEPEQKAPSAASPPAANEVATADWIQAIRSFLNGGDEELRQAAALALIKLKRTDSVDYLIQHLPDLSIGDRQSLADSMDEAKQPKYLPLLQLLLRDASESVRESAARRLIDNMAQPAWADMLFAELLRKGTSLQPYEVFNWSLMSQAQQGSGQRQIRRWLPEFLKPDRDALLRQFGLLLLTYTGQRQDVNLVSPWLKADDPWARRAALQALSYMDPQQFGLQLEGMKDDTSEQVRILIPLSVSKQKTDQPLYFDEQHFVNGYRRNSEGSDFLARMGSAARTNALAATRQLTRDRSAKVRLEAMMALLSRGESVDPQDLMATLAAFSDQKAVGERIGNYLGDHYRKLGRSYAPLLPYLKYSRSNRKIRRKIEDFMTEGQMIAATGALARVEFREAAAEPAEWTQDEIPSNEEPPVHLIFFEEHGCDDCAQAIELLQLMQTTYSGVTVETHDIVTHRAKMRYDELAEDFQMPAEYRRLTPAIFGGAGYLVRDDINFQRLAELIVRSQGIPDEAWHRPAAEEQKPTLPLTTPPPSSPASLLTGCGALLIVAGLLLLLVKLRKGRQGNDEDHAGRGD